MAEQSIKIARLLSVGKYKVRKRDGGKWNWTNRGGGRSPAMGLVGLAECPLGERVFSWKGKGSPYSIAERRVPELIPVLGSQPAGDVES